MGMAIDNGVSSVLPSPKSKSLTELSNACAFGALRFVIPNPTICHRMECCLLSVLQNQNCLKKASMFVCCCSAHTFEEKYDEKLWSLAWFLFSQIKMQEQVTNVCDFAALQNLLERFHARDAWSVARLLFSKLKTWIGQMMCVLFCTASIFSKVAYLAFMDFHSSSLSLQHIL
jgi:hypothetical protein